LDYYADSKLLRGVATYSPINMVSQPSIPESSLLYISCFDDHIITSK